MFRALWAKARLVPPAPPALILFAATGLCGGWEGMPASALLFGFAVLPGLAFLRAWNGTSTYEGTERTFAGPGLIAAALSVSVFVLVPALLPLFALRLPLAAARWTLGGLLLVFGVMCLRCSRPLRPAPTRGEWIAAAVAVAALLPHTLEFAGGTVDDWWDLGFVRSYAEHASLSFAEPVLGTGRVHPRFAWNGWLLLQALVATFSHTDPVDLQTSLLPALTVVAVVAAAALLARAMTRRRRMIYATLFFVPLWLWGTEAIPFFTRLHQDKFVAGFVLVPVMLAAAIAALERPAGRSLLLAAIAFAATSSVHGLIFAAGALGVIICCGVVLVGAGSSGADAGVRVIVGRLAPVIVLLLPAGAYPTWQAWSVRGWFAAEGISLGAGDNPVIRAHLGLERLLAPGSWLYVVHPAAVFGPIALLALLGTVIAWRSRSERTAAYLLGLTLGPCSLLFVPGVAALAGAVFVPWMLYRVGWLVPVAQLSGWLLDRLASRRDTLGRVLLVATAGFALLVGWTTATDRLRRDMMDRPARRERTPRGNEWSLLRRVHDWPEAGTVLAPPGISTLVAPIAGRATVATSERGTVVFSGDEADAYRRLRDRADFYAYETDTAERERIVRRYGVRLVVFRKRFMTDGSDRDWLWRSGPEGFLASLRSDSSYPWTHDAIVGAIPPAWAVVFENADFGLVRTTHGPESRVADDTPSEGKKRPWLTVFEPDRPEPALSSPVLASLVTWPGGRARVQPVPASLGSSVRPVWTGGGQVWDDDPDAVALTFDFETECLVDGIELIPFLRSQRREVLEIRTSNSTRRLRAIDGRPLYVSLRPTRMRDVHVRIRSMVGEGFAFWDVRVHGDPSTCDRALTPSSYPQITGGLPAVSELVNLGLLYPNDARASVGLARKIGQSGQRADARALLRSALERDPNAAPVWLELGLLSDADGDQDAARDAYRRGVQADSNSAWARGCSAWAELRQSRNLSALYQAWQASRLDPRYSDAYTIMGASARALHLPGLARTLFQRAMRLDRLRSWPYLELAGLYAEQGDVAAAVRVLESFLALVPDDEQARALLSRFAAPRSAGASR